MPHNVAEIWPMGGINSRGRSPYDQPAGQIRRVGARKRLAGVEPKRRTSAGRESLLMVIESERAKFPVMSQLLLPREREHCKNVASQKCFDFVPRLR